MKAPLNWLREYVEIDMPGAEYAQKMVMTGTAVEGVEPVAEYENVVVGRVITCEDHTDSDHLHVCTVDVGDQAPIQIVCGAPNVSAGQLVPVALVGAKLPGGYAIKKGKLRGVESFGMICSGTELNVPEAMYPHIGDKGILVFHEAYEPGTDVKAIFGMDDEIIDFEILANRPDCLSIWGLARESGAVLETHCLMPEIAVEESGKGDISDYAKVSVLDDELCPRYCARVIADVKIAESPKWMKTYLHAAGIRPINNIVDITNFVMLETGHPMHAFDLSKVRDGQIIVRRARPDEILVTLDGKEHKLASDMLVIADSERATGIAGVMGGEESEIVNDTAAVLFECATFDRTSIRLTARALGVRTESSGRFERGVCVGTTMEALQRACMLVNMLECGQVVPGSFDHYPNPAPERIVEASVSRINQLISTKLSGEEMEDILGRLYIDTQCCEDTLTCNVPAWRGDIEAECDLAEEILRLNGYEHIPSTLMSGVTVAGMRSDTQLLSDRVKHSLVGMGFYESLSFSFVSRKWISALNLPDGDWRLDPVVIRNPLGEDTSVMRTSLVPSMLNVLSTNINRGNAAGSLFELAPVFEIGQKGQLPNENALLCIGMYGADVDFYALKQVCVSVLHELGITVKAAAGGDVYYHPGRKAKLMAGNVQIGQLGEIHPDQAEAFDITNKRVYVAELDMRAMMQCAKTVASVKSLPKFPAVSRDLALVMDESVGVGNVMDAIRKAAGRDVEHVEMFDIYRGTKLGFEKKSVAFSLTFRAADRTLTEPEIAAAVTNVLSVVEKEFGATLRA